MPSLTFGQRAQLCLTVIRVGCSKCWRRIICRKRSPSIQISFEVLCLGLSKAGKSSALSAMVGESIDDVEPTTGFNIKNILLEDINVNVKELGGGESVRPFWNRYFNGLNGLMFVIDGSSEERILSTACEELKQVLNSNQSMLSIPCLVLVTHQDSSSMRNTSELTEILKKAGLTNRNKKRWILHLCSIHSPYSVQEGIEKLVELMKTTKKTSTTTTPNATSEAADIGASDESRP